MDPKIISHIEATTAHEDIRDPREREKLRKQREVMNRVLANTVVNQLLESGCSEGEVIDFATEVLRSVNDAGFKGDDTQERDRRLEPTTEEPVEVRWRLEEISKGVHMVHGERVTLVPFDLQHKPLLEGWRDEPRIQKTYGHLLLEDLIEQPGVSRRGRVDYIIQDEQDRAIGLISLFNVCRAARQAELRKLLGDPNALGSGYAREATGLILTYAFTMMELQRVYLRTNGFNMQNIRLNEKLGFRFEGILRASEVLNRELIDVVLMSMLGREFFRKYGIREIGGG